VNCQGAPISYEVGVLLWAKALVPIVNICAVALPPNYLALTTWLRATIVSIQLNSKNIDRVKNGEVGISTDVALEKGYGIYIKKEHY